MGSKSINLIELVVALIAIAGLTFLYEISQVVTADGILYEGLADNLINGTGYQDTIRNDFILPSIGHPLIVLLFKVLGITSGLVFGKIMFALGLILSVILVRILELKRYVRLLILPILYWTIPMSFNWGVEPSLFVSIIGLLTALAWFWKKKGWVSAVVLALTILLHLLVRPIGLPLLYVSAGVLVIGFWRNRAAIKHVLVVIALPLVLFQLIGVMSNNWYDDSRLTKGTYSDIPLYCANNPYLNLETEYFSSRWKDLPTETYEEAVEVFQLKTTWQDRGELLKSKTVDFIKNEPGKAFKGFWWRFSHYTYQQPETPGVILFIVWLLAWLMFVLRFKFKLLKTHWGLNLLIVFLPIYIVGLTSIFPYVGVRYTLSPNVYFIISIVFMMSLYSSLVAVRK
ncbi:MAG: hypothetical protein JKY54_12030 [Flavobacteriales bacterium]|nr:hypothetical protein [Flavobacteriales bacterium]